MSTFAMKEAFHTKSGPIKCIGVRMRYTDDRHHQILEFDIVQDGKQRTIVSDPLPISISPIEAAAKIATEIANG